MNKFYLLNNYDLDGFAIPNSFGEEKDRIDKLNKLLDKDYSSLNKTIFKWDYSNGNKIPDITFLISYLPVCNKKVLNILQSFSTGTIESLPFTIEEDHYYLLTNLPIVKGGINTRKSTLRYFSNGNIMDIKKYVFSPFTPCDCIFKIEEISTANFITEDFYNCLQNENIKGLTFEECPIHKPNIIDKLFKIYTHGKRKHF